MGEHAVVIAGGGPTGLMLAGELALAGVDVAIVERRASQDLVGFRGRGLHSRTIEVFDQRGIAERFLSQGQLHRVGPSFPHTMLDISDLPTRHSYFLALWQQHIERIARRLGRRAWRAHLSRTRGHWLCAGVTRASTSRCPTARRCARNISSAATEDAAWSVKQRASSLPGGIRPRAG